MGDRRGTVFFDYDGTLHDTMALYGHGFSRGLRMAFEGGLARAAHLR